jgi:hypothetical protein
MTWARAAAVYLVAAVVLTWPLATRLTTHLGAVEGPGDPFLNLWILGWGMQSWLSDPAGVLAGRVFDANIFHPAAGTLTFSDHLLLQSLVLSPLYAATGNVALSYNVLLILSLALSGLAMHLLARAVTGSDRAALVAGLAWACWPYRTAHLLHLQLQALYVMPLVWWALHRVAAANRWRDAALTGVFAALQAVSSVYYGVMGAVAVAIGAVALAGSTGQWRSRRFWSRVAAAAVIGTVLIVPVAWPYYTTSQREGFGRNLAEAARHAGGLDSFTQVPHENLIYGASGLLPPRPPSPGERDRRDNEHQMFPGLVLLALASFGAWRAWRTDARPLVITAIALVAAGGVLSLGPEGAAPIYGWVADLVFGFEAIRAPARFAVVAMLGLCLLAALGVAKGRVPASVVTALVLVMSLEYVNAPLPLVAAPPGVTPEGQWLRDEPAPGAVLYLPLTFDKANTVFMVESLEHRRPIVNGYSGQRPSFFTALVDAFADPTSVDARVLLRELEVRFVVSPEPLAGSDQPESPYVERETFGDRVIYEVVWTDASEGALGALEVAPPPAPGPPPFRVGEVATYDVEWVSGPLDVSAGTITLAVVPSEPDDALVAGQAPAWVFEVTATTAPWVSRFFDARDRFRTSATADLLPLLHRRFLREGRRVVDRVYAYDREARHVRSGERVDQARDPSAMTVPMTTASRDALTALWYLRALPAAEGDAVTLPINEAGRNLMATVTIGSPETIEVAGAPRAALRVVPALTERVRRRQAIETTIWLSADRQRLPLAADITAGFGRVRLKLVNYRP